MNFYVDLYPFFKRLHRCLAQAVNKVHILGHLAMPINAPVRLNIGINHTCLTDVGFRARESLSKPHCETSDDN
jgi:hypothetical protein